MLTLNHSLKNIDNCKNNPEKFSTTKIGKHIPCGYSMSTIRAFDHIENKHNLYCGEDCMKKFCESFREHAQKNIIDFEKKNMLPLRKKEAKLHQEATECYICRKIFVKKFVKDKITRTFDTIAIMQVKIEVQYIVFVIQDLMYPTKFLKF